MSRKRNNLCKVTLTYNFPGTVLANTFIRRASISLIGRNLLYFAEKKDIDKKIRRLEITRV